MFDWDGYNGKRMDRGMLVFAGLVGIIGIAVSAELAVGIDSADTHVIVRLSAQVGIAPVS